MFFALITVVAFAQAPDTRALEALAAGETREIVFEEGAPVSRALRVELPPSLPATLIAWATSAECDPRLRLENEGGELVGDDDGKGDAHTSCVLRLVKEPAPLVLRLSVERTPATVQVHVAFAPESALSIEMSDASPTVAARARSARERGDFEESAVLVREELGRLLALLEREASWNVSECLGPLGELAYRQGELELALASSETALATRRHHLPRGHALYRGGLNNLAICYSALGRPRETLELLQEHAELCERSLPADSRDLIGARYKLAQAWRDVGETEVAMRIVRAQLGLLERLHPDDGELIGLGRSRLADYAMSASDFSTARALYERTLADAEQGEDQLAVAYQQANLGWLMWLQGDPAAARPLQEQALRGVLEKRGPDELEVQRVRVLLAMTLSALGDHEAALALEEQAFAAMSEKLAPDHPKLLAVRSNLAISLCHLGRYEAGRELLEGTVALLEGSVPDDDETLLGARRGLALALTCTGDFASAKELIADVDRIRARSLPADDPTREATRTSVLGIAMHGSDRAEVIALIRALTATRIDTFAKSARVLAPREVASLMTINADALDWSLSFGAGYGAFESSAEVDEDVFAAIEATRAVELASARILRGTASSASLRALREMARAWAQDVARLANSGDGEQLARAVRERDRTQRELLAELSALDGSIAVRPTPAAIGASLASERAAVSYWRYHRARGGNVLEPTATESFVAFVVRSGGDLRRFELGDASTIASAVEAWRAALLADEGSGDASELRRAGARLRELVLDPLAPALEGAQRIDVALDDVLHAIALDALPREGGYVGDALDVRVHAALSELLLERPAARPARELVVFGGIDFGTANQGFLALPNSGDEARAIASLFEERHGDDEAVQLVSGAAASREELERLAPRARYLHLATHGYFAADNATSTADTRSSAGAGGSRFGEQVLGLSPMSLCGLALADANRPADVYGKRPGLLTAEELAAFDLGGCELAVLSACDTNVGVRRAGQGVQSLQKALHMAGARTVVTSLWQVGDAATRELMTSFYRHVWIDGRTPARALWEAKRELRARRAKLRDWAGWVLSGE